MKRNKQLRNLSPPSQTKGTVERNDEPLRDVIEMTILLEDLEIPL
jgi:hypothetical protein